MADLLSKASERMYTTKNIMEIMGVGNTGCRTFLNNAVKNKWFKVIKVGKAIRIEKSSFEAWLESEKAYESITSFSQES